MRRGLRVGILVRQVKPRALGRPKILVHQARQEGAGGLDADAIPAVCCEEMPISGDDDRSCHPGAPHEFVVIRVRSDPLTPFGLGHERALGREMGEQRPEIGVRVGGAQPIADSKVLVENLWRHDDVESPIQRCVEKGARRTSEEKAPETTTFVSRTTLTSRRGPRESPWPHPLG